MLRPLAAAALLVLAGCGGSEASPPRASSGIEEADVREHFAVEETAKEPVRPRARFMTARVTRRTAMRGSPGGRVVTRIGRRTEFGSPRVLAVTERRGRWLRVTASERRNGEHGWIPASAAWLGSTDVWIRVDRLRTRSLDSTYGCCALALSGHQTKLLPGWPGGDRLAIHATPNPETVGHPASLGCMRAHDHDIRVLMRRVPLGAPVVVVA